MQGKDARLRHVRVQRAVAQRTGVLACAAQQMSAQRMAAVPCLAGCLPAGRPAHRIKTHSSTAQASQLIVQTAQRMLMHAVASSSAHAKARQSSAHCMQAHRGELQQRNSAALSAQPSIGKLAAA